MDTNFAVAAARPNGAQAAGHRAAGQRATGQRRRPSGTRPGFTLVEMLTVIVIIAILASFVTGAVITARRHGKVVATGLEISQLDAAMKAYKQKYNSYPPDFAGLVGGTAAQQTAAKAAVLRHLSTAFPRYQVPTWDVLQARLLADYGVDINAMDPAAAIVFWLGGPQEAAGSNRLVGFSANPKNPFDTDSSRLPVLFEFDPDRLKSENGVLRCFPDIGSGETAPYVYFKATSNSELTGHPGFIPPAGHANWGSTGPCRDGRVPPIAGSDPPALQWVNRDSFQIRAPGLDGVFGAGVMFPRGDDYNDDFTLDDQTNFSDGTLEDKM